MVDKINFVIAELNEKQLVELIKYHNQRYWSEGEPEISDERYDELIRALQAINPDHQLVTAVLAPQVAGSGKITHEKPMLSLDKAYSFEDVFEWAGKNCRSEDELYLIQPKYDGISANYQKGILATRGDGEQGENITDKLPLIELESTGYTGPVNQSVRGEIVIRDDDFRNLYSKIKRKGGGTYKNSRNAVAGIMGLKDITDMLRQHAKLTLVDYEMISFEVKYRALPDKWAKIAEEIEQLPYPMDGIVIKLKDEKYSESLGSTAHHPRGQIAFKFSGIRKESKLLKVDWSFGKNCLTPVAEIDPVDIGGITIRHASLHNAQNIIDKDIRIGDRVVVERAGDVIPYIVSALPGPAHTAAENNPMITKCPNCESELVRSGPELRCPNPECSETRLKRLTAAVKNIGIERLGEPNIRRMMATLGVMTLKDIFDLKLMDILQLEGFKSKSANNLFSEISTARTTTDFQVLAALNIPNIGPNVAKMILNEYTLAELRELPEEVMAEINGVGPERAGALRRELKEQSEFLDELLSALDVKQTKGEAAAATICFTGKMPEKRSYYEKIASEHGYEPVDHVNKELSLLVAMNPDANGGKLKKARSAGVKIMGLENWLQAVKNGNTTAQQPPEETEPEKPETSEPPADDLFSSSFSSEEPKPEKKASSSEIDDDGQIKFGF
ncbi:helix-hairpin-helix domain-containing protein [Lentisphaerota bacterium ZTH]|nr:hypothetical protein JYG24_13440 [Lentisphaerota bacterium]WET05510.1 helix-hairpin-helix domain-containing protein [Lentisphaerota bacterium ZTH]